MSILRRSETPLIIASIITLIVLADDFIADPNFRIISTTIQTWAIVLAGFALGVGSINLFRRQIRYVQNKEEVPRSLLIMGLMIIIIISGVIDLQLNNPIFRFILDNVYVQIYAGTWAFQYFFGVYAFYRSYKIRNVYSLAMLLGSVFVIIKNAPVFEAIIGPSAAVVGDWIFSNPNLAGQRAINMSASLGLILIGLRTVLGKERGYIRGGGEGGG
jgi:hypothetical protein